MKRIMPQPHGFSSKAGLTSKQSRVHAKAINKLEGYYAYRAYESAIFLLIKMKSNNYLSRP